MLEHIRTLLQTICKMYIIRIDILIINWQKYPLLIYRGFKGEDMEIQSEQKE